MRADELQERMLPQDTLSLVHEDLPPHTSFRPVRHLVLALVRAAEVHEHRHTELLGRAPELIERRIVERDEDAGRIARPVADVALAGLILDLETGGAASNRIRENARHPRRIVGSRGCQQTRSYASSIGTFANSLKRDVSG